MHNSQAHYFLLSFPFYTLYRTLRDITQDFHDLNDPSTTPTRLINASTPENYSFVIPLKPNTTINNTIPISNQHLIQTLTFVWLADDVMDLPSIQSVPSVLTGADSVEVLGASVMVDV
jgi:hypothetical protein